jgi:hypothetical protein
MKNEIKKRTPKPGQKIRFEVSVSDTESEEVEGKIIELLPNGKVKAEYIRPEIGWPGIKIVGV